jgi:hypothetical protein
MERNAFKALTVTQRTSSHGTFTKYLHFTDEETERLSNLSIVTRSYYVEI